jgi:pimeloyl-ACP methyl ester carboxylesterase
MQIRRLLLIIAATGLAQACVGASTAPSPAKSPTLFVDCRGQATASPTVILESGAFGSAADWDLVLDDLAKGGRACAYDRAGVGRSPPRSGGQDVTAIAQELKALLDQIGEGRPVILVGHSNGALYAETFAALWPERVAGLLYINGVTSDDLDYPDLLHDLTVERRLADLAGLSGDIGLAPRVSDALAGFGGFSGEAARRKRLDMADPAALRVARDEDRAVIADLTTARMLGGSPARVPTAVVSGQADPAAPLSKTWQTAEQAPARRAAMRLILNVPNATHTSPLMRDRGYVATAVDWLRGNAVRGEP